jgi:Luciferase-like monooxygenase
VTPRHPGVLVKTVTTLDVLSGGRAWLGIGAAWNEEESRGLGIPFPPLGERFERLEETLRIARQGRPYEDVEKTTYGQLTGTESAERLVERFQRLAEEGVDHAIVELPDQGRGGSLERLAEVVPAVSSLAPAGR